MKYVLPLLWIVVFVSCDRVGQSKTESINEGIQITKVLSPEARLDSLNKMIRENPESPNGYHQRSNFYFEQGMTGKAREDLNICINMSPETSIFYLEKAELL